MRLKPLALLPALLLAVAAPSAAVSGAGLAKVGPNVTITYPTSGGQVDPGDLHVLGTAGSSAPTPLHSVLFVTDLSGSTDDPDGLDCNGDGTADGADDLNADGSAGDVLDCEISGVIALNNDLGRIPSGAADVKVGAVGFASDAATAQLSPTAGEQFVAPTQAISGVRNVDVVMSSMYRSGIGEFLPLSVDSYGTDFDAALGEGLAALASRTGTKWMFFMSDGISTVSPSTLSALASSGVKVRTFAIGRGAGSDACNSGKPLAEIAATSGESCTVVMDPSRLAANLTGSQPGSIDNIVVSGLGAPITASVDALGNWDALAAGLTPGSYTATAVATFTDGDTASDSVTFTVTTTPSTSVERWAGADRYEASASISEKSFSPGVGVAFIASGLIFTDALSGSPVAGHTPGPMLLVKTNEIPSAIKTELARLQPKKIVVLGGPATISTSVSAQLQTYTRGSVERWDGKDRYEASARISAKSFRAGVDTAFIASGLIFTDALSGSPIAGHTPGPVLLVKTNEIPSAIKTELARLGPKEIVVLGGPATINDSVQRELDGYTSGGVDRWDGLDRYEASAKISAKSFRPGVKIAFISSGLIFTDALSGSPIAGKTPGPMLLVKTNEIPPSIDTELNRLNPDRIVILGGPASVSTAVESDLAQYLRVR